MELGPLEKEGPLPRFNVLVKNSLLINSREPISIIAIAVFLNLIPKTPKQDPGLKFVFSLQFCKIEGADFKHDSSLSKEYSSLKLLK